MSDGVTKPPGRVVRTLKEDDIVSKPLVTRRSVLAAIGKSFVAALGMGIAGCAVSDRDPSDPSRSGRGGGSDADPGDPRGGGGGTDRDPSDPRRGQKPGLYGSPYFGSSDGNLFANVGLPVEWTARAPCRGGDWNMSRVEIATGALPPGLRIGSTSQGSTAIIGVPERAGTWHLRIRFVGITCAGNSYNDYTQDLHIKTEGSSVPRPVR